MPRDICCKDISGERRGLTGLKKREAWGTQDCLAEESGLYDEFVARPKLQWQSKTILLLVFPFVGADVVLETHWWATQMPPVAVWTLTLSVLLGLVAFKVRSATAGAALAGAAITASLMFATVSFPYVPWRTGLVPVLVLLVMTSLCDTAGTQAQGEPRNRGEQAWTGGIAGRGEPRRGRAGFKRTGAFVDGRQELAAVAKICPPRLSASDWRHWPRQRRTRFRRKLGQVLSGHPRMITTFRRAEPGTDGAISVGGTVAGIVAAGLVAAAGTGHWRAAGGCSR